MKLLYILILLTLLGCDHPEKYPPMKIEKVDQTIGRSAFGGELPYKDHGFDIVGVPAWREMYAHYYGRGLFIKKVEGGKEFGEFRLLVFEVPDSVPMENIKVELEEDDFTWMNNYDKREKDNQKLH